MKSKSTLHDPLQNYPGYLLRRISVANFAKLSQRLKPMNIKITDATVLIVLQANPGARQSDIGRLLGIASANMTPLISRLEKRGFVARKQVDGRSHGLVLTALGEVLAVRTSRVFSAYETALMHSIPVAQRSKFIAGLLMLMEALGT